MLGAVGMDIATLTGGGSGSSSGGDIWSTGIFNYDSPIKDLLDTQNYTLEQLLQEDELLQEIRGCHEVLISFLSTEKNVTKLVQYVIQSQHHHQQQQQHSNSNNNNDDAVVVDTAATIPYDPNRTPTTMGSIASSDVADKGSDDDEEVVVVHMNGVGNNTMKQQQQKQPGAWLLSHLQDVSQSLELSSSSYDTASNNTNHNNDNNNNKMNENLHSTAIQQQIRFPYMACEIICCEIPSIIQTLVEGKCQFDMDNKYYNNKNKKKKKDVQSSDRTLDDTNNGGIINLHTMDSIESVDDSITNNTSLVEDEIVTSDSQGDMVEVIAKSSSIPTMDNVNHPSIENTTTLVSIETKQTDDDNDGDDDDDEDQHQQREPISILDLLFSLLYVTPVGELDDYRAGYFDKILSVLFRKCPNQLSLYINSGGIYTRSTLISCMISHLYSHSIMQIAQRLLLPQRPIGQPQQQQQSGEEHDQQQQQSQDSSSNDPMHQHHLTENGAEIVAGDDGDVDMENNMNGELGGIRCDWSNHPEVLDMLLDTLIGPQPRTIITDPIKEAQILDLSLNASEVLITIIQNSMLSSSTMLSLTSHSTVQRILDAATTLPDPSYFSPHESIITSAMNVLESLVLQLGGYGAVGTMTFLPSEHEQQQHNNNNSDNDNKNDDDDAIFQEDPISQRSDINNTSNVKDFIQEIDLTDEMINPGQEVEIAASNSDDKHLISDLGALLDHLPQLLDRLSFLLRHPSTSLWVSPTQYSKSKPVQLLGNSRLRIVRVLESLVLLGDPDVDNLLVQSNCLEICLDFFWEFQWCSMLHQSVANLLVHVFEGQNTRYEMQKYFLVHCNLLGRLMDSFTDDRNHMVNTEDRGNGDGAVVPSSISTPNTISINTNTSNNLENIQDVSNPEEGSSLTLTTSDRPLDISEDDVDAAMEAQADVVGTNVDEDGVDLNLLKDECSNLETSEITTTMAMDLISTDAIQGESREVSTVGDIQPSLPAQTLRCGYMGHVIIICQALVHAYTNNPNEQEMMDGEGMENSNGYNDPERAAAVTDSGIKVSVASDAAESNEVGYDEEDPTGPKDMFGEPLLLYEIVHTHTLVDKWHDFVETTLATETSIQSTPLGGLNMHNASVDMMQSYRPGLADEGYMMGDDGEGPPVPPRGMLGGGDMIMMDENDLDIAASLMARLNLGRPHGPDVDEDHSNNSADSEKSYNSGETASEKGGYAFDDPLGKAAGLGIELGKLTQFSDGGMSTSTADNDDGSHSSDEDMESRPSGCDDVPVMDLFAGNFNYDQAVPPTDEFANFAEFDLTGNDDIGVFAGVATVEPLSVDQDAQDDKVAHTEIEDLFGTGDHAELLELDDIAIGDALSPIKPTNSLTKEGGASTETIIDTDESHDLKSDLFNSKAENDIDEIEAVSLAASDIESAPSDEMSSYSSESRTQNVNNEDI